MNLVSVIIAAEDPTQSHHWLFPEIGEIIYGGLASLAIFFALYKFGWPAAKKALETRTATIQKELDDSANARRQAETDAANIRKALGDVASERAKLLAEADAQAAAILAEGRARITAEVADMEARANAEIAAARSRIGDELRAEIARLSAAATASVVRSALDDRAHQDLVDGFIAKVGASR
ncbi:MAG: synthase subunit [Actinomycetota bacterium]